MEPYGASRVTLWWPSRVRLPFLLERCSSRWRPVHRCRDAAASVALCSLPSVSSKLALADGAIGSMYRLSVPKAPFSLDNTVCMSLKNRHVRTSTTFQQLTMIRTVQRCYALRLLLLGLKSKRDDKKKQKN